MNLFKTTLLATALVAAFPMVAQAESQFIDGAGNANAKLDFQVKIPRILFLRVGSDSSTINLIDFSPTAAQLGNGTVVAGTGGDGTADGAVTAQVRGNNGNITLLATTGGALSNGDGDSISYSQINTAATAITAGALLAAPVLTDGASTPIVLAPTQGSKITVRDARWTFSYANSATVPAGTYGGINTNNSRVTYTASMP